MDSELKKWNRKTEKRLLDADNMISMEAIFQKKTVGEEQKKQMRRLWKTLLFDQFHDTLGGTTIKPARDEAISQMAGACAEAKRLYTVSMQKMMGQLDTRGEGFPLFVESVGEGL